MTREIKFRAWQHHKGNSDNGWMTFYSLEQKNLPKLTLLKNDEVSENGRNFVNEREEWMDYAVMQFTGLKDRNGKEIYEADVIQTKEFKWLVEPINSLDRDGQVYGLMVSINGNGECFPIDKGILEGIVIGNIYENPELLN